MTTPNDPHPPLLVLLPADASAGRTVTIAMTDDEGRMLDALRQAHPNGLTLRDASARLGVHRFLAGRILTMLVRLRVATRVGRYYHVRKEDVR